MILEIYIPLVVFSIILAVLGLFWYSHSELAIIGFIFLFLLSLMMYGGDVEYRTGSNMTATINYAGGDVSSIDQTVDYEYINFDNANSQQFGKWSSIGFASAFILTLIGVGRSFL